MGSYIMLVINPDAYSRSLLGKGTDPAYMQAMLARFQIWMIPGMAVGTLMRSSREVLNHCPGRPDSSPPVPVPICFSLLNTPMKPCLRFSGYLHRGGAVFHGHSGKKPFNPDLHGLAVRSEHIPGYGHVRHDETGRL